MKTERKKEIIHTAARLFKEKGYNAVSMRDLAESLGIKASSLYNHIASKQEILGYIILEVAENFTEHITRVFPQEISTTKKLEAIVENHIEITLKKTDFLACMNNDWMHLDEANKQQYLTLRNAYEFKVREILGEGMKQNELKSTDLEITLFSLLSTLRTLYLWYSKNNNFDEEKIKQDLRQILLSGVIK